LEPSNVGSSMTLAVAVPYPQRAAPLRAWPWSPPGGVGLSGPAGSGRSLLPGRVDRNTVSGSRPHYSPVTRKSLPQHVTIMCKTRDVERRTVSVTPSCHHSISPGNTQQAALPTPPPHVTRTNPCPETHGERRSRHRHQPRTPLAPEVVAGRPARYDGDGEASTSTPGRALTETVPGRYASPPAVPSSTMCPRNTPASPSRGADKIVGRGVSSPRRTRLAAHRIVSAAEPINAHAACPDAVTDATHAPEDGALSPPTGPCQHCPAPLWPNRRAIGHTARTPAQPLPAATPPGRFAHVHDPTHAPAVSRVHHPCPGTLAPGEERRVTLPCPALPPALCDERSGR
jgi:hypothetical protein